MTSFEQMGCNYQYLATTKEQAIKSFEYSCNACTHTVRCMYNDCDHCAIRQTHNQIVAILSDAKEK